MREAYLKIISLIIMPVLMVSYGNNSNAHYRDQQKKKHVIGYNPGSGLFSSFFCVLNHLYWCSVKDRIPVVYWDKNHFFYTSQWGNNVWSYYFDPVSHLKYSKKDTPMNYNYPSPEFVPYAFDYRAMTSEMRMRAYNLIARYIKIKQNIIDKIDRFYLQNMAGKKTIGIHLRGTDKYTEENPVSIEVIARAANQYPDYQFLIATDEQKLLDQARALIKGRIVAYDCYRSPNEKPLHIRDKGNSYKPLPGQLGEDVLVEAILLSRCDKLFHTYSNVSFGALCFNPNLENRLFTS
jgi:hypothetical protein